MTGAEGVFWVVCAAAFAAGWSARLRVRRRERDGDPSCASTAPAAVAAPAAFRGLARVAREMSALDWLVLAYFALLVTATELGHGPRRTACLLRLDAHVAMLAAGLVLVRGGALRSGTFLAGLVYRVAVFVPLVSSYFELREILPVATSRVVDAQLFALDMRLFGVEPALAWDALVTPATTEYFSFFYFSYFPIISVFLVPSLLLERNAARLAELAIGIAFVFAAAHLLYMCVPGYGPHHFLAGRFAHALSGRTFWPLVSDTVRSGGAEMDIFPSLHTAAPLYFTLFCWRNRRTMPFRAALPVMLVFASQIIASTMFLRWHYLIDVVAGVALACGASWMAARVAPWEAARRARLGRTPAWPKLF